MTVQHGMVIGGELIPGTEWCLRDSRAWWEPLMRGTRQRAPLVDLLVGHATGGEASLASYDDDGPFVVRGMRARVRSDGSPLRVGIHFVIGACARDAEHAKVWQTCDPGLIATTHVGLGAVNRRSIGVEIVSALFPGPLDHRKRSQLNAHLLGKVVRVLAFERGQARSWVRLAEAIAGLDGLAGIAIPKRVPAQLAAHRFTRRALAAYSGAMEHLHVPGTKKSDAAGLLVAELLDAGWQLNA
jgi:hypothetical protein